MHAGNAQLIRTGRCCFCSSCASATLPCRTDLCSSVAMSRGSTAILAYDLPATNYEWVKICSNQQGKPRLYPYWM